MRCDECRFWEGVNSGMGVCRIRPPVIVTAIMDAYIAHGDDELADHPHELAQGHWPRTIGEDDWCGEFQATEKTTEISP